MDLKKIIKETINDFDWVDDLDPNIWDLTNLIVFDTTPTMEEFYYIVEKGINTLNIPKFNKDAWLHEISSHGEKNSYNSIIKYMELSGYPTIDYDMEWGIRIGRTDTLPYRSEQDTDTGEKSFVYFSEIKNYILTESNDFDWVDNLNLFDFIYSHYEHVIDLIGSTREEKCEIQKKLIDRGAKWASNAREVVEEYCSSYYKAYVVTKGVIKFLSGNNDAYTYIEDGDTDNTTILIDYNSLL